MPPSHKQLPPTHITLEEEDARRTKLFVVRDQDWETVWAANLPYDEAHKIKEHVATRHKSRVVMLEEMPTDPELLSLCLSAKLVIARPLPPGVTPPTPEQLAKRSADQQAAEARRKAQAARKAADEAVERAKLAAAHAERAAKEAEDRAAQTRSKTVDPDPTPSNGAGEIPVELAAEAEIMDEAPLEDLLE